MLVFSWANEKEALGVLAIEIELARPARRLILATGTRR